MENHNSFPVQLLHRNWYIFDSMSDASVVSGEGVVGEQPTLKSQDTYTYMSGCELYSEIGYMKGFYTFNILKEQVYSERIIIFGDRYELGAAID